MNPLALLAFCDPRAVAVLSAWTVARLRACGHRGAAGVTKRYSRRERGPILHSATLASNVSARTSVRTGEGVE